MAVKATPPPGSMTQKQARAQGLLSFLSMTICRKAGCDTFHRYTAGFGCMACKARQDALKEATKEARQAVTRRRQSQAMVKAWARRRAEERALEAAAAKRQATQGKRQATRAARLQPQAQDQQAQCAQATALAGTPWDALPDDLGPMVMDDGLCAGEPFDDGPPW